MQTTLTHQAIIQELKRNQSVFQQLLQDVPSEMITWKTQPDKWCLLEIVCHLHDEEREDFRVRTKQVLENPSLPLPPINPPAWVTERKYMEQDFSAVLQKFLQERAVSITWLESLQNPSWDNVYHHPKVGPRSAWMYLSNWLAHDYLHIRQITRLKYDYLGHRSGVSLDYAGNWV